MSVYGLKNLYIFVLLYHACCQSIILFIAFQKARTNEIAWRRVYKAINSIIAEKNYDSKPIRNPVPLNDIINIHSVLKSIRVLFSPYKDLGFIKVLVHLNNYNSSIFVVQFCYFLLSQIQFIFLSFVLILSLISKLRTKQ